MGMFLLTIIAITVCALINIYDAKKEVKSKERSIQIIVRGKMDLEKKIKQLEETIEILKQEKKEIAIDFYQARNLANELADKNKKNEDKYWERQKEVWRLERENKTLKAANDELMDKIINHLKAKDIITNKTTKAETPKIKANEIIKPVNNSTNWQIINKHGLSVNKMYKENPYYNPFEKDSLPLTKTNEYKVWIKETLRAMEKTNIKSLRSMNVNPNKPMKLEVEFKLVRGSDTDNPLKSFIDLLVRYYGLTDDNNFVDIHVSRNSVWAKDYSDGQIKFKISNI